MDAAEYSRREKFLNALKQLGEPEYLEILRLLQKKNIHYSENANGVFFDIAALDQETFNSLEQFIEFVKNKYQVGSTDILKDEDIEEELAAIDDSE
jgi:hypothetical protein